MLAIYSGEHTHALPSIPKAAGEPDNIPRAYRQHTQDAHGRIEMTRGWTIAALVLLTAGLGLYALDSIYTPNGSSPFVLEAPDDDNQRPDANAIPDLSPTPRRLPVDNTHDDELVEDSNRVLPTEEALDAADSGQSGSSEALRALKQMKADLVSDDPARQHAAAMPLLARSMATILTFQGRPGGALGSMKRAHPNERVIAVNGKVYRFSADEYPAWDALNAFYDANQAKASGFVAPLSSALLDQIHELADYALVIEQGH